MFLFIIIFNLYIFLMRYKHFDKYRTYRNLGFMHFSKRYIKK